LRRCIGSRFWIPILSRHVGRKDGAAGSGLFRKRNLLRIE
jgi:hypothetical protein